MCGIVAVIHGDPESISAAADIHDALYLLQHRGQDACGIATCASGGRIYQCKGNGMASQVFQNGDRIADLPGPLGLGHLRYPTAGTSANSEAQPMYVNAPHGIVFTHNGNLINAPELRIFLDQEAHRHINTDSDSEVMLNIFAHELNETRKARINAEDCFAALERLYEKCRGAWACIAMIAGFGLIAFRDSYGIRPLLLGERTIENQETDYMLASESVALKYFGCSTQDISDIRPGEAVIIEKGKTPRKRQIVPFEKCHSAVDIFEHVYLSRPDSTIDGISVYTSRRNMGFKLGQRIKKVLGPEGVKEIDAVIPIPETATSAAKTVSQAIKKSLIDGFIKNRYIFRTFIMPTQKLRRTGVRRKLNAIESEFKGRTVLLVDDSIVRGTTSKEIVAMAREAGAKKVIFASCAPQITHQHIYGIDLASSSELIAFERSDEEIAHEIGADAVIFQTLDDLVAACAEASPSYDPSKTVEFEVGVFTGKYITPVGSNYLRHLDQLRGERKRSKAQLEARQALLNGKYERGDVELLTNGAYDLEHRCLKVTPSSRALEESQDSALSPSVRDSQDINLHNLHDS